MRVEMGLQGLATVAKLAQDCLRVKQRFEVGGQWCSNEVNNKFRLISLDLDVRSTPEPVKFRTPDNNTPK